MSEVTTISRGRIVCLVFTSLCILSPSIAQSGDQKPCVDKKYVFEENAQARFALMLSLREVDSTLSSKQTTCSLLSRKALQNLLAVEWTLDRLNKANNGTGYINNVTLGFTEYDDCRSPVYSARNALSFGDPWLSTCTATSCSADQGNTLNYGIIGPVLSRTAVSVASLFKDLPMPVISMSATATELSNKTLYPTFLRTAPPDQHQMTMIADLLHQLSWTYVVVIYENDQYGTSGAQILEEKARERHICIHKSMPLPNGFFTDVSRELFEILMSAKDYSLGVVFIGSREKAEQFLWRIEQNAKDQPIYGLHFIFTDAVNVDKTIFDHKEFGQGSLSVGPSGLFLEDMYTDIQRKFENVRTGKEKHQLLEAFIKENPDEALFDPGAMSSFIPLTVHAVLGLVNALKLEHDVVCKGMPGICPQLFINIEQGDLLKRLYNTTLDYATMPAGITPEVFREQGLSLSFDENGDMRMVNDIPTYTLYQFDKGDNEYKVIGSYTDGVTTLKKKMVKMLTAQGELSTTTPPSVCQGRCDDTCNAHKKIPLVYMEGDAYILGIVSMHEPNNEDPFECGPFRTVGTDAIIAEGFLFAVKELRRITGINFGAVAFDDCYSPLRITSLLSDFFSGLVDSDSLLFPFHFPKDKLVGVIACRSSGCTIPTASFFMPLKVPVVSYAASSPDLDDEINFPYFLRSVPSDLYQARVMLEIVNAMGWEYVGLMYVRNNYGSKAMQAFKNLAFAEGSAVCAAPEVGISETQSLMDPTEFFDAWKVLFNQDVKVVVFFGIDSRYRAFLSYLENNSLYGKFIFIGSEDWGNTLAIPESGPKAARGSITLKVETMGLEKEEEFMTHLMNKQPRSDDENIWFSEFWQTHFKCNFQGGFINEYAQNCNPTSRLSLEIAEEFARDQRVVHAMNAVYALGLGIRDAKAQLCEGEFPCKFLQQYVDKVLGYIKSQTRREGSLDMNVFDAQGNGAMGFDVYNVQQSNNQPIYVKVGTFNNKEKIFQKEHIKFYTDTGNEMPTIESKCTTFLCGHCPKPSQKKADTSSEMAEVDCEVNDFRTSDVLIISLIAVLILAVFVAIAVMVLCCNRKYNSLSKQLEHQKEDAIYAEPETRIYQGDYLQTHGMVFANLDADPYRLSDDAGQNIGPRPLSRSTIHRGLSTDRVDSVSQVIQPDVMSFRSQPGYPARVTTNSGPVSHFSDPPLQTGRPAMGISYVSSVNRMSNAHDNPAFIASSTELNSQSPPPTSNVSMASTPGSGLSSGPTSIMRLPVTSLRSPDGSSAVRPHVLATQPQGMMEEQHNVARNSVIYYMQGPDGQLTAQLSPQTAMPQIPDNAPGNLALRSSIKSDGSSGVNPDFGPYNLASAQKKQSALSSFPMTVSSGNGSGSPEQFIADPNGIELQQMHPVKTHQQNLPLAHHMVGPHTPIHYASPSRNPNSQTDEELLQQQYLQHQHQMQQRELQLLDHQQQHQQQQQQHQQQQQQHQQQQQQHQQQQQQHQQQQQQHQQQQHQQQHRQQSEPYSQPVRQVSEQEDVPRTMPERNSLNASIPDIVGQLSEQTNSGVMESVDLSSSRESLDDQGPKVKIHGNGKANFSTLAAFSGNASRV